LEAPVSPSGRESFS